jgi:predicted DNA binding protein
MSSVWREPYHVVLEIENKHCKMVKKLVTLGLTHLKVVDIRSSSKGSVKHLIDLGEEQIKKVPKNMFMNKRVENKSAVWMENNGCKVCNTILMHDAFLVSGKSLEEHKILYSFLIPTFDEYQAILADLKKAGHKVNVCKIGKFEQQIGILTENQERIFWLALKSGFFNYPRQINMVELSKKLGISTTTLSEIMRRGIRRLLEHYFRQELQ